MNLLAKTSKAFILPLLLTLAGCGGGDGLTTRPTPVNTGSPQVNPGNQGGGQQGGGEQEGGDVDNGAGNETPDAGPQLPTSEISIETVSPFTFEQDVGSRSDKVIGLYEFALRDVTNDRYVRALDGSNMTFRERPFGSDGEFLVEVEATQSSSIEVTQVDILYLIDSSFSVVQAGANTALIEQSNNLANEINNRNSAGGATANTTRYRTFADSVSELQTSSATDPFEPIEFEERGGGTALYQGIQQALTDLSTADQPVLFVFTDGRENASRPGYSIDTILSAAQQYGIPIYIAGLGDVDSDVLNQIAITSGGQFFQADTVDQLSDVFEDILYSIPAEYSVSYRPTQRSGHVEFQFVVEYGGVSDAVVGDFNVDTILNN